MYTMCQEYFDYEAPIVLDLRLRFFLNKLGVKIFCYYCHKTEMGIFRRLCMSPFPSVLPAEVIMLKMFTNKETQNH